MKQLCWSIGPDGLRSAWPVRRRADTRLGQGARLGLGALSWHSVGWGGRRLGQERRLQALGKGRQGLLASAAQAKGVRHSFLNAVISLALCLSSSSVHSALRLRLAQLGWMSPQRCSTPPSLDRHHVRAIALRKRRHRLGIGLGQRPPVLRFRSLGHGESTSDASRRAFAGSLHSREPCPRPGMSCHR